jgi:hypothetical protein
VLGVLVVPGIGTYAEDPRIVRLAACGKGSGVEPVSAELWPQPRGILLTYRFVALVANDSITSRFIIARI